MPAVNTLVSDCSCKVEKKEKKETIFTRKICRLIIITEKKYFSPLARRCNSPRIFLSAVFARFPVHTQTRVYII